MVDFEKTFHYNYYTHIANRSLPPTAHFKHDHNNQYIKVLISILQNITVHGKFWWGKLANRELPKFSLPIFTDALKMYLAYALTVAYSSNFPHQ